MDIIERLALTRQKGVIVLFSEGLFLRFYNESAYCLTQQFKQPFKLQVKYYKKLNNQGVIMGGLLASTLVKRLPNAEKSYFGYQIVGDFDMNGYQVWQAQQFAQANQAVNAAAMSMPVGVDSATALLNRTVNISISLNQLAFLQQWQKGECSHESEHRFIAELKQQCGFS